MVHYITPPPTHTHTQVDESLPPVQAILKYSLSDFLPQQHAYIKVRRGAHLPLQSPLHPPFPSPDLHTTHSNRPAGHRSSRFLRLPGGAATAGGMHQPGHGC